MTALEVDRTSRFSKLDTFCEPATEEPAEAPEATDPGITEDSISITHIRVTLEDLEDLGFAIPIGDPADQAEKFVGIINDRCGGIHGRTARPEPRRGTADSRPRARTRTRSRRPRASRRPRTTTPCSRSPAAVGAARAARPASPTPTTRSTSRPTTSRRRTSRRPTTGCTRLGVSSADGLEYLARTLDEQGAFDGKTIGIVMQDSPGDPDIVEQGLIDTLEELGRRARRASTRSVAAAATSCNTGVIESVQGMIADGVDVMFPLLNVINLPAYIGEMVTQGVQPGEIQFYQSGYNAQNGDLVSSKVVEFGGEAAGELYNGTMIIAPAATGAFRLPDFEPNPFAEMCNREYQEAGGDDVHGRPTPRRTRRTARRPACAPSSASSPRALEAAGPNPTREDLAAAVEGLGAIDTGGAIPGSFGAGQVHRAERAEQDDVSTIRARRT